MFHIYNSVTDLDVEFIHEVNLNHKFDKLESHQQSNLIGKALNEDCFEGFIVKVVMLDGNAQELSIVFLKTAILLFANLQFESNFHS